MHKIFFTTNSYRPRIQVDIQRIHSSKKYIGLVLNPSILPEFTFQRCSIPNRKVVTGTWIPLKPVPDANYNDHLARLFETFKLKYKLRPHGGGTIYAHGFETRIHREGGQHVFRDLRSQEGMISDMPITSLSVILITSAYPGMLYAK